VRDNYLHALIRRGKEEIEITGSARHSFRSTKTTTLFTGLNIIIYAGSLRITLFRYVQEWLPSYIGPGADLDNTGLLRSVIYRKGFLAILAGADDAEPLGFLAILAGVGRRVWDRMEGSDIKVTNFINFRHLFSPLKR